MNKSKLYKEVEKMKVVSDPYDDPMYIAKDEGFNQAIDQVLHLLKNYEKK